MHKRLIIFDFDGTLVNSPEPLEGRKIWKEKKGSDFPHQGWWGKTDSLDTSVFDIQLNKWVYDKYLEAMSDPENYVILATGRLDKVPNMRRCVMEILNKHNLSFDEIHLNPGGDTFHFKSTLFEDIVSRLELDEVIMYDDRESQLLKFDEWAKEQDFKVTIFNIVDETKTVYKK